MTKAYKLALIIKELNNLKSDKEIADFLEIEPSHLGQWKQGRAQPNTDNFLNLLDKHRTKLKCVIDINPKKQHRYVGGTGHYIIKPGELAEKGIKNIIVMNSNYIDEIRAVTEPLHINLVTL